MRRTAAARGRDRRTVSVSLFPFLAVLICTMGALILLLVVLTRQARVQAARLAETKTVEHEADLSRRLEDVRWRIEQLNSSREANQSQLAETRLLLGHLEDHARQLRDRLARLEATWAELERAPSDTDRRRELQAEIARLTDEAAAAEKQLAETRRQADRRRKAYAVVPYKGPNGTHRRPIYIECREHAVVLQPEGVRLGGADFRGPLGPENPLASAVRAAREYLLVNSGIDGGLDGGFDGDASGEPYPLLLVRPRGIASYQAAREAMKSWGSEFGYELIGEDWKLAFGPPDAELAEVMRQAIDSARVRGQRLADAAPRRYRQRREQVYTVSPGSGGVVPYGDSRSDSSRSRLRTQKPNPPLQQPAGAPSRGASNLSAARGRNWALPDAASGAYPLQRPIRIDCHADRLVLVPERGLPGGKTIRLGPRTEDSVDELVSAVWDYMESWGIAGSRMYWKPVLRVHVAPGAQKRLGDLKSLLQDSGLELMIDD